MVRPLLGDIELQQVQKIETEADQTFTQHSIPALEGDFFQGLGRRNTWVKLSGVLTGAEVKTGLKNLRDKFREAQPVDFIADIATATQVNQVVIEEMGVRELAGKPARFEYAFTLREYIPAPAPRQEPPPPIPPRLDPVTATLIVEVIVEGEPTFDFSKVTVTMQGTQDEDNTTLDRTLTNRANNIWTEADFPPGNYTARAIVSSEPELSPGSATAVVQSGQTTQVTITLRRDPQRPTNIAKKFVVHFWFDKAFVEPCMRHVLRQVADYARNHADEKMLIVGNTDESGRENYNLSLGDRRARSVYAYLTSGRDQAGALAEWNLLRRPQDGQPRTVKDNWNVRQYQYILQTLGFYPGNVKDTHDALTTQGVRDFQTSKGLLPTGVVNDATWEKLIEAYLSLDPQAVADAQFFRNCGDEPLKWVSCGEQQPRDDTPLPCSGPAWRPNRRTEILFVRADRLPRPEPIPETFNLPGTPPVGSDWCVGPNTPNANAQRCNFLKQNCSTTPAPDKWCVEPVESGSITVSGSIEDENGNSLGEVKYVLIAPDGKFMDGERQCGTVDRGRPSKKGKTALDGTFAYTAQSPIGVYTMEVELPHPPQVAHAKTKPPATGRGSVVCKRLDSGDAVFDVIIRSGTPSQFAVNPLITLTSAIVVVKKSYTNPARQLVTLKTDAEFIGSGTFERSNTAIRFFTAATDGTEITFNGTDNVFDGAQLTVGVPLFAEGATPSPTVDDVLLTLTLSSVDLLVGSPATATMTAVELTLEIGDRRSAPGIDPVPLSTAAKIDPGRFLEVRNPNNTHERALLIVRQANPTVFTGDLELNAIDNKVQIFAETDEVPASGQTTLTTPQVIPNSTIPADGVKFWAGGVTTSSAVRDTGFQLGIRGVELVGDRVAVTVIAVPMITLSSPIVVVRKPHTNPARRLLTLRTTAPFTGSGTLTRSVSGPPIRLFDQATGGSEVVVTGAGHTFTGSQLTSGVQLFAESTAPSTTVDDYRLTLMLTIGGTTISSPATATITAVEVTLDIALRRPAPGAPPPVLSATDKINTGRFVQVRDPSFSHERAMLIVRPPNPLVTLTLELVPLNSQVQALATEIPASGQTPLSNPHLLPSGSIPATGTEIFAEGISASSSLRDTGFRLGIQGLENECDRITMTVLGDPAQPGPFPVGELNYPIMLSRLSLPSITETFGTEAVFDLGVPPGATQTTAPFEVNVQGLIRYPAQTGGVDQPISTAFAQYPLIVIAHGNHRSQFASGVRVGSFTGLEYLARHLASYGYIAVTIDLDDMNIDLSTAPPSPLRRDPTIIQRGLTILEHIRVWNTFNTSHPRFTGKVNLSQIGLIGHSRGGEAVVAAQKTNVDESRGHQIKGVVSIAPTDFLGITHSTTPYLVLYGSQDEDVGFGWPFRLYDRAAPSKSMIFIYGAIHNRFSTHPDWLGTIQCPPFCLDSADPRMISATDHLNIARGYSLGFFDFLFRDLKAHEALFKRNGRPPVVPSTIEIHHQIQDSTRLVVDNFEQGGLNRANPLPPQLALRARTNSLGQSVTASGLVIPGGLSNALTEASLRTRDLAFFWHETIGGMIAWNAAGGIYATTVANRNVSAFQVLSFRVTQRFGSPRNPAGALQDFLVTLVDTPGQFAAVQVGTITSIPFPYERFDDPTLTKSALKTVRIPVGAFKAVNATLNLTSIQSVQFRFGQTTRGEIAIDDIEFSN